MVTIEPVEDMVMANGLTVEEREALALRLAEIQTDTEACATALADQMVAANKLWTVRCNTGCEELDTELRPWNR